MFVGFPPSALVQKGQIIRRNLVNYYYHFYKKNHWFLFERLFVPKDNPCYTCEYFN